MTPKRLFSALRKHFKKNEYNYKNTNIMSETKEQLKQFQWKKGDNFGKIETVKSEDSKFYYFESGGQIFKNVTKEFMEEVIDGVVPLPNADKLGMFENKPKKSTAKSNPTKDAANQIVEENQETNPPSTWRNPPSAIEQLVEKLSKKNIEKFETSLNLNIPTKDIYTMLIENSEEDPKELIDTIAKVAVSKIEINKLQEYLTEEITNFINNYYNE